MRKFINLALLSTLICTAGWAKLPDDVYNEYIKILDTHKYKEGIALLTPYAQKGDDEAQVYLGYLYGNGFNDKGEAIKWYKKAADAGNAVGKYNIALLYYDMFDYKSAFNNFEEAYKLGNLAAGSMVGIMYYRGLHVERDYKKAVKYLIEAADKGEPFAQFHLAQCYKNSHGVPHDKQKALELLQKAAKQGYEPAKKELGIQ